MTPQYSDTRISSVQSLSRVRLFATPWTAPHQASLSITNSQSLLKLMSIKSVMPSNHLILCRPLLHPPSIFPSLRVFSNESVLCIRCQSIGVSASASVLPMSIQDWFPLGSPCCPRDSQESSPTPQNFDHSSKTSIKDVRINSCYIKYCQVGLVLAPPHTVIHVWKICPR